MSTVLRCLFAPGDWVSAARFASDGLLIFVMLLLLCGTKDISSEIPGIRNCHAACIVRKLSRCLYRALCLHRYYERSRDTIGVECVVLLYPVRCMCSFSLLTSPSYSVHGSRSVIKSDTN
jgi:hypothetical protein